MTEPLQTLDEYRPHCSKNVAGSQEQFHNKSIQAVQRMGKAPTTGSGFSMRASPASGRTPTSSLVKMAKPMTQIGLWPRFRARFVRPRCHVPTATPNIPASRIAHSELFAAANGLVALLGDADPALVAHAENALQSTVLGSGSPSLAAQILALAVDHYVEHRRTVVAELLVRFRAGRSWLAVEQNPLTAVLRDSGHPIHLVIRGLIRRGVLGDDVTLLWRAMAEPAWTAPCREHLGHRLTRAERAELRAASHLGLNPRRSTLAEAGSPAHALAQAIDAGDVQALEKLAAMNPPGRTAAAAMRAIAALRPSSVADRRARVEAIHRFTSTAPGEVHPAAAQAIGEEQRVNQRRLVRLGRQEALRELRGALNTSDAGSLATAVHTARQRRMAPDLEADLCRVAVAEMPRPAAAACAALRATRTSASMSALLAACESTNARVAATAVESLSMVAMGIGRFADIRERLIAASHESRHRVRAAAARALVLAGEPGAHRHVVRMLTDSRPAHRLAGLWCAERCIRAGAIEPEVELAEALAAIESSLPPRSIALRARVCRTLVSTSVAHHS